MLTKHERVVLKAVIDGCGEKSSCLVSPSNLLCRIPHGAGISEKRLSEILNCLEYDGYLSVILSDRHGEIVYCITLQQRGKGYKRESLQEKRYVASRVLLAVASAFITFTIGRLLYFLIK